MDFFPLIPKFVIAYILGFNSFEINKQVSKFFYDQAWKGILESN